jgi:hypothetical protein
VVEKSRDFCNFASHQFSKRPTIPFVQCAAGNGPAFPGVGDWIFTFVLAEMRVSGCSVLLS